MLELAAAAAAAELEAAANAVPGAVGPSDDLAAFRAPRRALLERLYLNKLKALRGGGWR